MYSLLHIHLSHGTENRLGLGQQPDCLLHSLRREACCRKTMFWQVLADPRLAGKGYCPELLAALDETV